MGAVKGLTTPLMFYLKPISNNKDASRYEENRVFLNCSRVFALSLGGKVKGGHKGRAKRYTSVEEVREQEEKKEREQEWRVSARDYHVIRWYSNPCAFVEKERHH